MKTARIFPGLVCFEISLCWAWACSLLAKGIPDGMEGVCAGVRVLWGKAATARATERESPRRMKLNLQKLTAR